MNVFSNVEIKRNIILNFPIGITKLNNIKVLKYFDRFIVSNNAKAQETELAFNQNDKNGYL